MQGVESRQMTKNWRTRKKYMKIEFFKHNTESANILAFINFHPFFMNNTGKKCRSISHTG